MAVEAPQHPPTYWELILQQAATMPDVVLLEDEAGRTLTIAQYRDEIERMAAGLYAEGIGPGTRVGWQLPTSIDTLVLLAALARLGAVQTPILPILREREVRYITSEARTELMIVRPSWRSFDYESFASSIAEE